MRIVKTFYGPCVLLSEYCRGTGLAWREVKALMPTPRDYIYDDGSPAATGPIDEDIWIPLTAELMAERQRLVAKEAGDAA